MSAWSIERMEPDDWQRVRAVRLRSLADAPDAFGTQLEEDEARPLGEWRERLANPVAVTFLAVRAGTDVGITVSLPWPGREGTVGLFAMWVAPEARGHGIGGGLVDAVAAWARDGGYARVALDVADDNEPAVALYRSKGFVRSGATGTLPPPRTHITEHERVLELD